MRRHQHVVADEKHIRRFGKVQADREYAGVMRMLFGPNLHEFMIGRNGAKRLEYADQVLLGVGSVINQDEFSREVQRPNGMDDRPQAVAGHFCIVARWQNDRNQNELQPFGPVPATCLGTDPTGSELTLTTPVAHLRARDLCAPKTQSFGTVCIRLRQTPECSLLFNTRFVVPLRSAKRYRTTTNIAVSIGLSSGRNYLSLHLIENPGPVHRAAQPVCHPAKASTGTAWR